MGRTSRRNQEMRAEKEDRQIRTASYCRLSVEKGEESDSIQSQIDLTRRFIEEHEELTFSGTYIDNGFTGTSFERPAFRRMIEDIRSGKIACVVVKDLSRFGRNYLETGYYIENVFPILGARLLAVTDHFDSARREDMEGLALPIKNLVNELYARDISRKVWSSKQRMKREGNSRGNCAPYGYIREGNILKKDLCTEQYVRLIFAWALSGVSVREIARRLERIGAPCPRLRQHQLGHKYCPKENRWRDSTLAKLLENRVYIGDTVTGKTEQAFFAGREKYALKREEWIIREHTHEAIIKREDFEQVQKMMADRRKKRQRSTRTGERV